MAVRKRKPTSAGRRFQSVSDFSEITKDRPERTLVVPLPSTGGRNSYGRKTARHRGGGHKRQYRIVDFWRDKDGIPAKVAAIEYDPNRNARIALLHYADGEKRYILAPAKVAVGDKLQSGQGHADASCPGNAAAAAAWPSLVGSVIHNLPLEAPSRRRRRQDGARRRDERAARREGGVVRDPSSAVYRNAARLDRLPRHARRGR